ncbi:Nucleoside diphosphate kinase [Pseudolycoriella hygida]|uniref:Nucleoside diphosphate kinase n=1 Tax=Pseudolycoriella hygida TaxID=35572 RepID=A0A9Q0N812_9DIPT|nr:Nucleoside diphosphate kinase [Pseudolycoriella hygida]
MLRKLSILIAIYLFSSVQFSSDAADCGNSELFESQDVKLEMDSCSQTSKESKTERTFALIKPDGVQRNLIGDIIRRYEVKGLKLLALKFVQSTEDVLRAFYYTSRHQEFFDDLIAFMKRGPVVAMIWEGYNAVTIGRQLLTGENRFYPLPGSIRGDYSSNDLKHRFTVAHGSDTAEEAEREIALWFNADEVVSWNYSNEIWIYQTRI